MLAGHTAMAGSSQRVRGKHTRTLSTGDAKWAHPRVCGENRRICLMSIAVRGSSPRVRGKRISCHKMAPFHRLIPACAGKTRGLVVGPTGTRAHPRVCGENVDETASEGDCLGSSPRVRGKPPWADWAAWPQRLIPACAGKTLPPTWTAAPTRAHPRVCGENAHRPGRRIQARGSSPRVRGKLCVHVSAPAGAGLIPACAGKTVCRYPAEPRGRAHPRVCGENSAAVRLLRCARGSSPRVRGKLLRPRHLANASGLIPACAGKTKGVTMHSLRHTAHPRVCGENNATRAANLLSPGSSPRVRGKQPARPLRIEAMGLIPACAGKTEAPVNFPRGHRAHPRVCGENSPAIGKASGTPGSSPRVRGKHDAGGGVELVGGLIPACAGKTVYLWCKL